VFVHQTETQSNASPQPQPGIVLLDDPNNQVTGKNPEQRFKSGKAQVLFSSMGIFLLYFPFSK
jgi:hypothetical protein